MKKWIALLTTMIVSGAAMAQLMTDSAWRADVKTVQLYGGDEGDDSQKALPVPVLTLGNQERLVLEFDVLTTESEHLRWSIRHCNRTWQLDSLTPSEFMTGFAEGQVNDYDFSFTTLTEYIHYRCVFPDQFATFTHSGNYVLTVSVEGVEGDKGVLLTRRFCVSEQTANVRIMTERPYDGNAIDRRQEVDVAVETNVNPEQLTVVVQQNGRLDNLRQLEFSGQEGRMLIYANRQCNLFDGGNTFRYFDCSNLRSPMYNVLRVETFGGEHIALLTPNEDRSKKHFLNETTLNGGMKVNAWDRRNPRLEADYVWVNISLPMMQPMIDGNIYVVGALTDWKLDASSKMEYNEKAKAYAIRLRLKQGYYAYQLLFVNKQYSPTESKTARLEGDHFEMPNRYTVYVYQHTPMDRADRLVRVRSLNGVR